jgi:predicted ATP-grasp superfamily ATP-dependent carboligase/L-amino acid N-acyltransferase YncA
VSHTLDGIIASMGQEGLAAEMRLLSRELYDRKRFCLLERHLGPEDMSGSTAENVRLADSSSVDRIAAAWPAEFGKAKGNEHVRRKIAERFENGYPCLISENNGQVEGAVWCIPWQFNNGLPTAKDRLDGFEICNLFVTPQCRGRGVGRRLLDQALSLMARQGKKTAYSRILPERRASMALHLDAGFHVRGIMHCSTTLGRERYRLVPLTRASHSDLQGMEMPPCVLLTRTAWGGTLEAIRSLGSRGVPVYVFVLGRDPTVYARSRYCREAHRLVGENAAAVSRELLDWCASENFSQLPLLLPMIDILATFVAEERRNLEKRFIIGAARPEIVLGLLDKGQAGPLAAKCGLDVPQSAVVKTRVDLETAARRIPYPVIAKPVWWREQGSVDFKALIYRDQESLVSGIAPALNGDTSVLLQEYVEGTDQDIETFMFYRDHRGLIWGCTAKKLRQCPPNAGIMASGQAIDLPELRELCAMFLNKIDYQGLGGTEFKRSGSRLKYIETSARPEAIHGLSRKAGIDLVWVAYCDYCLGGLAEEPYDQHEAFYLDWQAFRASYGIKKAGSWLLALLKILVKRPLKIAVFEWKDPGPSIYLARSAVQEICGRIFKKPAASLAGEGQDTVTSPSSGLVRNRDI